MKTFKTSISVVGALLFVCSHSLAGNPRIPASSGHGSTGLSYADLSTDRGQVKGIGFESTRYWLVDFPANTQSGSVSASSKVYGSNWGGNQFFSCAATGTVCAGTSALGYTGLQDSFSGYSCTVDDGWTSAMAAVVPQNGTAQTVVQMTLTNEDCNVAVGTVAYNGGF